MRALIQRFALVRQARRVAGFSSEALQADQVHVRNYTDRGSIESGTPRLRYKLLILETNSSGMTRNILARFISSKMMQTIFECILLSWPK